MEELDLTGSEDCLLERGDDVLDSYFRLKRVHLSITDAHQLRRVASALETQNCSVEEMKICTDADVFESGINSVFDALQMNSTLKVLKCGRHIGYYMEQIGGGESIDWSLLSKSVCNVSSIEQTYNSNHAIQRVEIEFPDFNIPLDIYSLLYLNRNENKHVVARKKVLDNHSVDHLDYVTTSLPILL